MTVLAILLKLALVAFALSVPAWLLQASCSVCEVEVPGFGKAFLTALAAGLTTATLGFFYAWTVGWMISLFLSAMVAKTLGFLMTWLVTAAAYSAFLRIGFGPAAKVAVVQHLMAVVIAAVLYAVGIPLFF